MPDPKKTDLYHALLLDGSTHFVGTPKESSDFLNPALSSQEIYDLFEWLHKRKKKSF